MKKNLIENNWWDLSKCGVSWWYKKCHSDTMKYMYMLCFQCLLTCNKLGLCLSPTSKTRLLDECGTLVTKQIQSKLQTCSLCNLVGDNCDIRITPNHQAIDHQVRDCHYFGVLLFFSRMAEQIMAMQTLRPAIVPEAIPPEQFLLNDQDRLLLFQSYKVLLGRLMARNIPAFAWLDSVLPKHIPHEHTAVMSQKSSILPLELILKNEAKYEDCVSILDATMAQIHGFHQPPGKWDDIS